MLTNKQAVLTGLASIAEGLALVFTLGRYRPSWRFSLIMRLTEYKARKDRER